MNGYQQLKKQLLPLAKGLPFIAVVFILSVVTGKMIIKYSTTTYQSIAKIKLDDQQFGFSHNFIYKDFEMFSVKQQIEAEAQLLKSPLIVGRAVDSQQLNLQITRLGKLKNSAVYKKVPFLIDCKWKNPEEAHSSIELEIRSSEKFKIKNGKKEISGAFGVPVQFEEGTVVLTPSEDQIRDGVPLNGRYLIEFLSRDQIISEISANLDVKAADKETPILRVTYKDADPDKAADIVNAICKAYIDDYITTKSSAASQTVQFIDEQLDQIQKQLSTSERNLEVFKLNNGVVNTRQETETGLRELSKLRVDMINMDINTEAMHDLQNYIDQGDYFNETSINFGFGDLVLTEMVKKLKFLKDERRDKLLKYTEDSEQIKTLDNKISEIKGYVKEAISRNLSDLSIRREKLQRAYESESHMFDHLPTREKKQHVLEREFIINEQVYNFLSQKRIDAQILANSLISFHRVIQPAVAAKEPTSPNKKLITFISGLFGLIIGIGWIYFRQLTRAKVLGREDVEKHSELPFAGIIRNKNEDTDFEMLLRSLLLKQHYQKGFVITVASALREEGKSYVSNLLAATVKRMGYSVCRLNVLPEGEKEITLDKDIPLEHIRRTDLEPHKVIQILKEQYDFVILKSPPTTVDVFSVEAMRMADATLFLARANHTNIDFLKESSHVCEEFGLKNIYTVLNGAHKATNYSGNYIGSRFQLKQNGRGGIVMRLKGLYKTYVRS